MATEQPGCPTREEIDLYLNDGLPPGLDETVSEHLLVCATCRETLKECDVDVFSRLPDLSETRSDIHAISIDDGSGEGIDLPRFAEVDLTKRIGRGGFGDVYLARQLNANNRVVAVKILHQKRSSPESRRLVLDEVKSLTRIRHDNVAQVYQTCVANDGTLGIVMEFVEGPSLAEARRTRASRRMIVCGLRI